MSAVLPWSMWPAVPSVSGVQRNAGPEPATRSDGSADPRHRRPPLRRAPRAPRRRAPRLGVAHGAQVQQELAVLHAADDGGLARAQRRARAPARVVHVDRDGHAGDLGHRQRAGAGAGDRVDELDGVLVQRELRRLRPREQRAQALGAGAHLVRAARERGQRGDALERQLAGRGRAAAARRAPRGRACRCAAPAPADAGAWPRSAAARPTAMPACGPPSSLSPLKVTTSAPAATLSFSDGSSREELQRRRARRCRGRRPARRRARARASRAPPSRARR